MPKFTKGPWLVADGDFVYALNDAGFNRFSCPVQRGHSDRNTRIPYDEVAANASLIASAPDMYAALDAADTAFAVLQVQDLGSQARGCIREAWPLVQSARAKARPDSGYADAVKEVQQHEIARLDAIVADLRDRLADIASVLKDCPGIDALGSKVNYAYHVASGACHDKA